MLKHLKKPREDQDATKVMFGLIQRCASLVINWRLCCSSLPGLPLQDWFNRYYFLVTSCWMDTGMSCSFLIRCIMLMQVTLLYCLPSKTVWVSSVHCWCYFLLIVSLERFPFGKATHSGWKKRKYYHSLLIRVWYFIFK